MLNDASSPFSFSTATYRSGAAKVRVTIQTPRSRVGGMSLAILGPFFSIQASASQESSRYFSVTLFLVINIPPAPSCVL
jgi:hypothetical protein